MNSPIAPAVLRMSLALLFSIAGAAPAHADASCNPVYDAGIKQLQTPHHIYTTRSGHAGRAVQKSETIYAGGVEYMQLGGRWQRSPLTAAEMLASAQEKRATPAAGETCKALGDENVGDAAAAVYSLHNDDGVDSMLWLAKSDGSLLRQTITLPDGSTVDSRYDYANVQSPPGVR